MVRSLPRRQVLAALVAVPSMAALLAACSDSGERGQGAGAEACRSGDACRTRRSGQARRRGAEAGRHRRHGQAARARRSARTGDRQARRQGDDRRICVDDLPALRAFPCHDAAGAQDEVHRHRQGAADLPRVSVRPARRGRLHAGALLAATTTSRWSTCCSSSRCSGPASRTPRSALLQIAKLAGFTQEKFEACLTDQKLLEDVRAVRDRGAKDFGVDSTPTFFINGGRYPGAMSIEEISAIIDPLL